jgi:hypothetical protein
MKLEAKDGGHTRAKWGKEQSILMPGQGQVKGNIYITSMLHVR